MWGLTLASVPPPPRSGPVLLILLFPTPSSLVLPSFVWFCVVFPTGQVLLSALSCCSAFTSVSEGVFLMYPWKEMYSTSTYSSTILFFRSFIYFHTHTHKSLLKKCMRLYIYIYIYIYIYYIYMLMCLKTLP